MSRVRAKQGWIETKRLDKAGRVVKARDAVTSGLAGAYSAAEMEREMLTVADELGASPDQIRIETYEHGEAPVETDPMRGERMRARASSGFAMGSGIPQDKWDKIFGRDA